MLFESKAHTIMFFLAITSAILGRLFFTTQQGIYLLFALALFCVLVAALFIIGPNVAFDEGVGYLLWGITELIFYGLTYFTFFPVALAITCFAVAHHFKD